MKTSLILSVSALAVLASSCKKEEKEIITVSDYSQLHIGNYWIYERFDIDTNGSATSENSFDSCYIAKDSFINGNRYYKMEGPDFASNYSFIYLRDSLDYIVALSGKIVFSFSDFTSVFSTEYIGNTADTIGVITVKMQDKDAITTVPAGSFITSNAQRRYFMYSNWVGFENPRNINIKYSKGVGIVSETLPFFMSEPGYTERRLVRYHIEKK